MNNIFRIPSYLCALGLLCVLCVACEDYTEHNFGTPEELYQTKQVNQLQVNLTDYETIARNADNLTLADTIDSLADDKDSTARRQLQMLVRKKRFFGNITPEQFLPAIMRNLIGNSQYYTVTPGTLVTVTFDQEVADGTDDNAYILATGPLSASGQYLLVPKGEDQAIGNLSTPGRLYLTGSDLCPQKVNRLLNDAFDLDAPAQANLYTISPDGDQWLLSNADDNYLYLTDQGDGFNYIEDLGDIDDGQFPQWQVVYNSELYTYDILNTATRRVIRYDADNDYIVAVPDSVAANYTPVELYRKGHASKVQTTQVAFELTQDGNWVPKEGYLAQVFKGSGSGTNKADEIFDRFGWSVENEGSIGDLSYVWQYDSRYGMKASAFMSSTKYPAKSWLITPAIDLTKATNPVLTFSQTQKYVGEPINQYLQIWASTNYEERGMREQAKWRNITKLMQGGWPDGATWNFIRDTIPLQDFVGEANLRIAFRYISDENYAATWEVDSIYVKEQK